MYITRLSGDVTRPLHILSHYSIKGGAHIVPLPLRSIWGSAIKPRCSVVRRLFNRCLCSVPRLVGQCVAVAISGNWKQWTVDALMTITGGVNGMEPI